MLVGGLWNPALAGNNVLPNVLAPIIVIFSITIGAVIITEASLSFLGFGLPLSVPSWGGLLSREGRNYMQQAPWLAMWPGIFLTIVVFAARLTCLPQVCQGRRLGLERMQETADNTTRHCHRLSDSATGASYPRLPPPPRFASSLLA